MQFAIMAQLLTVIADGPERTLWQQTLQAAVARKGQCLGCDMPIYHSNLCWTCCDEEFAPDEAHAPHLL